LRVPKLRRKQRAVLLAALIAMAGVGSGGAVLTAALRGPGRGSLVRGPERSAPQWRKVWSDDFTGPVNSGVNQAAWIYNTGRGVFGTGEIETMTRSPANVRLDGHGDLDIAAIRSGRSWTSGRIQTARSFDPPAGREMMVSATIRQPDPRHGVGYWPAFWMLAPGPSPQSGEIDILEDLNALGDHSATFHCGILTHRNPDGTYGPCHEDTGLTSGLIRCVGCQTGYHTYSVVIDRRNDAEQQIRWYLDGRRFLSVGEQQTGSGAWTRAVDHGFSIIFDLAIGGSWPSGVCRCAAPTAVTSSGGTMSVRDVAVYER
jgi:beta-glucanase (GH16 family)